MEPNAEQFIAGSLKKGLTTWIKQYSQALVFERNSFCKSVLKPICLRTELYFRITNNVKEVNLFPSKTNAYLPAYTIYIIAFFFARS